MYAQGLADRSVENLITEMVSKCNHVDHGPWLHDRQVQRWVGLFFVADPDLNRTTKT